VPVGEFIGGFVMTIYDRLLIIDTETGGLDPRKNAILEVAGVVWERNPGQAGRILGKFRYDVHDPSGICEPRALEINGIDPARNNGMSPEIVVALIEKFIQEVYLDDCDGAFHLLMNPRVGGCPCIEKIVLAGHNVGFDVGFLKRLYDLADRPRGFFGFFKRLYRLVVPRDSHDSRYEKIYSHRLIDTCGVVRYLVLAGGLPLEGAGSQEAFEYFGITPEKAHTALGDAEATAKLLDKLIDTLRTQGTGRRGFRKLVK